jgi:peptidoglycan/xylan/chitin deacetylase (PgdA/CDA1 family)
VKQSIKKGLGAFMCASRLDQILLHDAAVVVAFHRIQDAPASDGLSVAVDMFARLCRFFADRFRVVSLSEIVTRLEEGRRLDRHLAITFDDGYRDNFVNAIPVLEKFALPATFFVVSDWIGTDAVPWWDREAGVSHPLMTWNEIRTLHRRGFTIGAHTRTHVDLGRTAGQTAWDEIAGARRILEQGLDAAADLFAYPYGRRDNLAEANRDLVRRAGFRCCCSCYGGIATRRTDPFHLPRVPISPWYQSPNQFGLELALSRAQTNAA